MKIKWAEKLESALKCSDLLDERIIDPKSQTIQEIMHESKQKWGYTKTRTTLHGKVLAGQAERVWKEVDKRLVPSYRLAKK